ncbi:MAG TPA: hypothetical protein VFE47_23845 [Tepidisphaeraceae bacterium]|jgi:hypothetical protein|nr:hypothetical protein [Tepidisphaeraceae bacterium]
MTNQDWYFIPMMIGLVLVFCVLPAVVILTLRDIVRNHFRQRKTRHLRQRGFPVLPQDTSER